jgi:hypothetical protein
VWNNHVNGGGIGFGAFFENISKTNACALIHLVMFLSPLQMGMSLLVAFFNTYGGNDE